MKKLAIGSFCAALTVFSALPAPAQMTANAVVTDLYFGRFALTDTNANQTISLPPDTCNPTASGGFIFYPGTTAEPACGEVELNLSGGIEGTQYSLDITTNIAQPLNISHGGSPDFVVENIQIDPDISMFPLILTIDADGNASTHFTIGGTLKTTGSRYGSGMYAAPISLSFTVMP